MEQANEWVAELDALLPDVIAFLDAALRPNVTPLALQPAAQPASTPGALAVGNRF
jgi:hypothetical protein